LRLWFPLHVGGRCDPREACLSHPPALRLGAPFGGGWVGIPPELRQRRPTFFGSDRTVTNRATSAASKLTESCNHWRPEPQGGQRSGHQSCGCGFHCTLAAGATPVRLVSPTHPPCGLAPLLGAGGWEYLLSCHNGGRCALAATQPPTIGQRVRPTSAFGKRSFFRSGTWRPMSSAQELCFPLPKQPGRQRSTRRATLSHPPALRLGAPFGGGWVGQSLQGDDAARGR
jgi:hypothetical protein